MTQGEVIARMRARCNHSPTIVRCKDCKYRNGDKDKPYCDRINPYRSFYVGDNDFCSWGEKNGNIAEQILG